MTRSETAGALVCVARRVLYANRSRSAFGDMTSMMFMTTMPPTTRAIRVIGVTTSAMAPVN